MSADALRFLSAEPSDHIAIDAIYFTVRVLRNSQRGYRELAASSESKPDARRLTERTIAEIEQVEGRKILELDSDRVNGYVEELEKLSSRRALAGAAQGGDAGATMLDALRVEHR